MEEEVEVEEEVEEVELEEEKKEVIRVIIILTMEVRTSEHRTEMESKEGQEGWSRSHLLV